MHYNICVKGKQSSRIECTVSSLKSIHERDGELRNFVFFGIVTIAYRLRGRQEIADRAGKAAII